MHHKAPAAMPGFRILRNRVTLSSDLYMKAGIPWMHDSMIKPDG